MACSSPDNATASEEAGFATAAATLISLGLALIAIAVVGVAISDVNKAHAELRQDQLTYLLTGAQARADLTMMAAGMSNRLRWTVTTPEGVVQVLAEAEWPKLGLLAASDSDSAFFGKMGVTDIDALRERLRSMSDIKAAGPEVALADVSSIWRFCAPSLISFYGGAKAAPVLKATTPVTDTNAWHVGDVWRIRVSSSGWTDDRIIRFSGEHLQPTVTIDRRLYRLAQKGDPCDLLFAG